MAKKIMGYIKFKVPAGKASMAPPVGPAFGSKGLNGMEFVKAFNAQTQSMEADVPLPVVIIYYADKSFSFDIKSPQCSYLLKKAAKLDKGSSVPHVDKVGTVTRQQIEEICKLKEKDLTGADLDANCRIVAGTARSMGIDVEGM